MTAADPFAPPIPSTGLRYYWHSLPDTGYALSLLQVAQQHPAPLVVICQDSLEALRLQEMISFFASEQTELPCWVFPDWETLPYDAFSPHQDIISQRLEALYRLPRMQQGIFIIPIKTLMQRLAPTSFLDQYSLLIDVGDTLDIDQFRRRLEHSGYHCVGQVMEHGEFAIRGALLDLYPMGSPHPYRIDFFDNEIDSIRLFDVDSQRTIAKVEHVRLLPAREFPLDEQGIAQFRKQWRQHATASVQNNALYQDVSQGIAPAGIEYYLPLFFEQTLTLFDYLPAESCIAYPAQLQTRIRAYWQEIQQRHSHAQLDKSRPPLAPSSLFLNEDQLYAQLNKHSRIQHGEDQQPDKAGHYQFACQPQPEITASRHDETPFSALKAYLATHSGYRVLFCAETAGRREVLIDLLRQVQIHPLAVDSWHDFQQQDNPYAITVMPMDHGLVLPDAKLMLLAEPALFGHKIQQRRRRQHAQQQDSDTLIRDLAELTPGMPVVHLEQGIGRYQGLQTITVDGQTAEFLVLSYAGEAKLYVPVASLQLISRYSGHDPELAPLHKLGHEQWRKEKEKAAEKVRDAAAELLNIYAQREAKPGISLACDADSYGRFSNSFPYEETPDQALAITSVLQDLKQAKPMDRLVCGDVGFGKTEVAMRAAFVTVQNHKQVAVLVPTTLLAQQHYDNFCDRFADWPVKIALLSRFRNAKQTQTALDEIAGGQVDIVIGTHKLLQGDINFAELGLLIIDEEHRFGVQQKERLKSLRTQVDILAMTATPIPRTLNMSLAGMRDLSIIATPPAKRLAIKTFVRQKSDALVREAILREVLRGGQVYYLHNQVKTIELCAKELAEIVPEARIAIAHGQMRERELEAVMADFYHHRFNVLVCSTIIETGIDVPTANTIIMDRADKLGLAQLHQLRGRVGRSHHQAYAYLLTPHPKAISDDAQKRLEAIASLEELGAGFALASQDMEIRGAGEILGDEQSGKMQAIGFSLYMEFLQRAIDALQKGEEPDWDAPLQANIDIDLGVSALIPEDYLPDVHSRLQLYKRIASASDAEDLKELQVEMIDRFGLLPDPVKNLFRITELKQQAQRIGITKLDLGPTGGRVHFQPQPNIDPMTIIQLIQAQPHRYRMDGGDKLKVQQPMAKPEQRFQAIDDLFSKLNRTAA